ncbi:mitochondrial ornithine transporter 1 [Parasteatoda tepidariorum]|uniref:mitochondrial ornithine transporter 1 n=1 Tax=Parasteatoda tepidariorum TaxID=114398 RepID=UPI00077FB0FE|nr:mitochondrial ornithine transporter 1 [Parasteatoda tepidariorum]
MESNQVPTSNFIKLYQHYITAAIDLTAGSAGGAACVLVGQPLDTIKVKMQTFPHLYKNSIVCFKQTILNERIRGLYAGTVPALVANIAENSVLFCAYGVCQNGVRMFTRKDSIASLNPLENATAGFFAALFSSVTLCPTELIKCKLQAMREVQTTHSPQSNQQKIRIGPWLLTKQILKSEGISGFFRGFGPTVAREMPGYFFFFGGYELSRILLTPTGKKKEDIGLLQTSIAGGIGGVCFWLAIFPADVIKSRIQISTSSSSMVLITREIIHADGVKALYKGLGPTILRTFPASGALFVAYEYTKYFLHFVSGCPSSSAS